MGDSSSDDQKADLDRRQQLFDQLSTQARTDQQASSDSFDNNLLTYSSALLGLSLAFIKDIVPLGSAVWLPCLYASWGLLAVCILATIASFRFGIEAQKRHQDFLYEYYINRNSEYFNKKSQWSVAVTVCGYIGAVTFFLAVVITVLFSIRNVSYMRTHAQQRHAEASKNSSATGTQDDSTARRSTDGQYGPAKRGAEGETNSQDGSCRSNCYACPPSPCKQYKQQTRRPKVAHKAKAPVCTPYSGEPGP